MMKALIIHDRENVANHIKVILSENGVRAEDIHVAEDYYSSRECLGHDIYDFVIVDLTIPRDKDNSIPSYEPVEQLLNELFIKGMYNIPGDVIGITRDVSALGMIETSLGPHMMVIIEEDIDGKWKSYLKDRIIYATRAAQTRFVSVNRHFLYDALVLTAMDREMAPFWERYECSDMKHFEGAKEFLFTDLHGGVRRGIAYSIGHSGQPYAASMAQALITTFRPKLALMSGYCGGVKGKAELGDLVLFDSAYAWDYGKWEETPGNLGNFYHTKSSFKARPNPIDIQGSRVHQIARAYMLSDFDKNPSLLAMVREKSEGRLKNFKLHLAPAASGSAVVANDDIINKIVGLNDSIRAVDMESYGFYHAAKYTQVVRPEFLCIKSVSDFCNGEKEDGLHSVCSQISASLAFDLLEESWPFS